ncbi:MAG: ABC transporter ATP-binding protein [Firmicutes bacterium]|nr:ABC transporter ATP-binding protein [Bacillota bacterium]
MALLKVEDISISFGGLRAVSGFNLELKPGELVGLIGPNGAGKTTVFNILTGFYQPQEGRVIFDGKDITGLGCHKINRLGIGRTFQNIRLFNELTVLDNVKIAYQYAGRYSWRHTIFRTGSYRRSEKEIADWALSRLEIFNLDGKAGEIAKNLPYGEQRRLEIARALAGRPKLLLLDEPAAGMNPQETMELLELIKWLRKEFSLTIFLIEHDMSLVMKLCERILVLDYGMTIAEGSPEEIRNNPRVIEAYLGEEVS